MKGITSFLFCAILITVVLTSNNFEVDTKLILVQVVFRHGDRTPANTYPNYPYNELMKNWEPYGGLGQLTPRGMKQTWKYGTDLAKIYSKFLTAEYNHNLVFVRSTDYDRTIQSAQCLLSGLYEPSDKQMWNNDLEWQPIPVHTHNFENIFGEVKCQKKEQLIEEYFKSDEIRWLEQKFSYLIDMIKQRIGQTNMSLNAVGTFCDNIYVQKSHGLALPDWIEANYEDFVEMQNVGWRMNKVPEIARLTTGGLLKEIKSNMMSKINDKSRLELALFSGHDTTISALSHQLSNSLPATYPPYVSSVLIELRQSKEDASKYFVQAFLKNNTYFGENSDNDENIIFHPIKFDSCDELLCPLDSFYSLVKDKIVDDFNAECKTQKSTGGRKSFDLHNTTLVFALSFVLCSCILTVLLALVSFSYIVRNKIGLTSRAHYKFERINLTAGDVDDEEDDEDDEEVFNKSRHDDVVIRQQTTTNKQSNV